MGTEVLDPWGPTETSCSHPTRTFFSGEREQEFANMNFSSPSNLKLHFLVNRHFTWKSVPGLNSELYHEVQAPLPADRSCQGE